MTYKKYFLLSVFIVLVVNALFNNLYAYNNIGSGICECDSCSDCTNALNDTSCYKRGILLYYISPYYLPSKSDKIIYIFM